MCFSQNKDNSCAGDRSITSNNLVTAASAQNLPQGYAPVTAKGHKESVYALAMNDSGTILVSGGTEKVSFTLTRSVCWNLCTLTECCGSGLAYILNPMYLPLDFLRVSSTILPR